jgi:peptidoglycan/xylan/chitin deacetylase (PgdA/CDA1 family)
MSVIAAALKGVNRILSPGGAGGNLTILTYHRVLTDIDPLLAPEQIDARHFDGQMAAASQCFNVLPLADAIDMLEQGRLPPRALSITFDDGYLDNHAVAWPILRRHGLTATFFVCTGYLGEGLMFNDVVTEAIRRTKGPVLDLSWLGHGLQSISSMHERRVVSLQLISAIKYLPVAQRQEACERLWQQAIGSGSRPSVMMTPEHVRAMAQGGMSIGGHTHTHPILKRISLDEARQDIALNREALRDITGQYPTLFAYPNGRPVTDYESPHAQLVKELGFRAAVSTARGIARPGADLFQLPRFAPWCLSPNTFLVQLLRNTVNGRHPIVV